MTDNDAEVSKKIASDYPELSHGFDCISENGTTLQIAKAFKNGKGKIVTLLPVNDDGLKEYSGVDVEATLVCKQTAFPPFQCALSRLTLSDFCRIDTVLGRPFNMWKDFPAMPEDKKATEEWLANEMPNLMGSGKLKSNPILSRDGGLNGINEGLDFVKAGKVSQSHGLFIP